MSLSDFHASANGASTLGTVQVTKVVPNWADDVEDEEYTRSAQLLSFSLPTAPRASRSNDDVPELPPYMAHLSNLPYDIEDDDVRELFFEWEIVSLRLPREDGGGRARGFGYIEFAQRNGLIAALTMPDPNIRNRRIRIDVSIEGDKSRQGGGGRSGGGSGGRYDGFGGTAGESVANWRKDGREDRGSDRDDDGQRRGGFGRDRDRGGEGGGAGLAEMGNWRDNMKKHDSPPPARRAFDRDGGGGGGGFGGDRNRFGGGDRYGGDRDRYAGRSSGGRYEDRHQPRESEPPAERQRLNLLPRTLPLTEIIVPKTELKSEHDGEATNESDRPEPTPVPAADIFGDAKPVDTAAREREIEARLERMRIESERAAEELREIQKLEKAAAEEASEKDIPTTGGDVGGEPAKIDAPEPIVNSWRRRDDEPVAPLSPPQQRRRFSPDRRGGGGPQRRNGKWVFFYNLCENSLGLKMVVKRLLPFFMFLWKVRINLFLLKMVPKNLLNIILFNSIIQDKVSSIPAQPS